MVYEVGANLRRGTGSQSVSQTETPVRLVGALDCRGRGVVGQHVVEAPAGEHHQVPLLTAVGEPAVGAGVPEAVRVHVGDAGLPGADVVDVTGVVGPRWPSSSRGSGRGGVRPGRAGRRQAGSRGLSG